MAQVVGLAADLRGTIALSDSSEASLRPALVPGRSGSALDLETTPSVVVKLDWPKSNVAVGYGPQFLVRDVFEDPQRSLLHVGYASYGHSGPRYHFSLTEAVSYGTQSMLTLGFLAPPQAMPAPSAAPPLNQLRRNQPVNVASESTSATLEYAWSHRWLSTFTASYGIAGGRDAESRQTLPRTRTTAVGSSLDYKLGRHDQLDSGVGLNHSLVSTGYDNWTVALSETWKHKLTKELASAVGAGIGWYTSKDAKGIRNSGVFPVATAGLEGTWILTRRRSYAVTLQAGSSITPTVNMYTGTLQQRAQVGSTVGIVGKKSALSFTLYGARAIPLSSADDSVTTIGAGLLATHNPAKFMQISAGYRNAWQVSSGPDTIPQLWIAFVALTLYAPPVHF